MKISKMRVFLLSLALILVITGMAAINASAADPREIAIDTGKMITLVDTDGNGAYEISNADELYALAAWVNNAFISINAELTDNITINTGVLTKDSDGKLVLNGDGRDFRVWTPIGDGNNPYSGTFEGNGYTISGLYVNDDTTSYVGLFGSVGTNGKVQNLGVVDSYLHGNSSVGGVVGYLCDITFMSNCYNAGVVSGNSSVGGVVGSVYLASQRSGYVRIDLINCYNEGTVSGNSSVGGVVGHTTSFGSSNYIGLDNCYNEGAVSGKYDVGGVLGRSDGNGASAYADLDNCQNTGKVTGKDNVGGILGYNEGTVIYCANTGDVIGTGNYVGGLVGFMIDIAGVGSSSNAGTVSGSSYVGGVVGYGDPRNCTNTGAVTGNSYVGGVAGRITTSEPYNRAEGCNNRGPVSGSSYVGGVVGYGPALKCNNTGKVTGNSYVGGVTGVGSASDCNNTADVIGTGSAVGGVVGSGTASSCSNTGTITGNSRVGGVVGYVNGGTVSNCYNVGIVSGKDNVGGVVGYVNGGTVSNCYNLGAVSGTSSAGSVVGSSSSGTMTDCYYLSDSETDSLSGTTFKTAQQFASGEVTYLLNGDQENLRWGQRIGTDGSPLLGTTNRVYLWVCPNLTYSNTVPTAGNGAHTWAESVCSICGSDIAPKQVTDKNYLELGFKEETYTAYLGYFALENADHLYWFAAEVNSGNTRINAVLTRNIVVNVDLMNKITVAKDNSATINDGEMVYPWTPIGCNAYPYAGTFDGNNKTISGLYFDDATTEFVGLLGKISNGTVKNVRVEASYLCGKNYVGGVAGYFYSGTMTNCYNKGTISSTGSYVGGMAGYVSASTVSKCYNTGIVSGTGNYIGGVFGYYSGSSLSNCYNTGNVRGAKSGSSYVGGVAGYVSSYSVMTNCYNTESVSGYQYIGGVAGYISSAMTNCYNLGPVSGSASVGGVVGWLNGGRVTNCYSMVDGCRVVGNSSSNNVTNCYYLSDKETDSIRGTTAKAAAQFKSGEVACLLGEAFGQNIDNGKTRDTYPVFATEDNRVYFWNCPALTYSNSPDTDGGPAHTWPDGICSDCGAYQPPQQITKENYFDFGFTAETYSPYLGYYAITNANHLYWLAAEVNSGNTSINAVLTANIVVNKNVLVNGKLNTNAAALATFRKWTPIGNGDYPYTGIFDGNGHTVSGLYFNDTSTDYVGLFGKINNGTVKKVGVLASYLSGKKNVGGVAGYVNGGTVTNCYNTGSVSGNSYVGSVVGDVDGGTVTNCYNTGSVSGNSYVGSVVGDVDGGTVTNCYYLSDSETDKRYGTLHKTAEQFAYGEVAYLLNGNQSSIVWGQTIGTDNTPVFAADGNWVYLWDCPNTTYRNEEDTVKGVHLYEKGTCVYCGVVEQVTEENYTNLGFTKENYTAYLGYYAIQNADNLYWFASEVGHGNMAINAVLTANIEVNKNVLVGGQLNTNASTVAKFRKWTPIGSEYIPYMGIFDGNGHTISGLYFNEKTVDNVGLFGYIYKGSEVKNVGIKDSYICGRSCVGNIVGYIYASTVTNCYNTGYVSGTSEYVGGVVGCVSASTVSKCYNTGYVSGTSRYVGGVAGHMSASTVSKCYNTGYVGGNSCVGGVVGRVYDSLSDNIVTNCYNWGTISGNSDVGGVVGLLNKYTVSNCYNIGTVSGNSYVGGVVGYNYGTVLNCYFLDTCGASGTGKKTTTDEFASGVVTWQLQNGADIASVDTPVWGQNIDNGLPEDPYPVFVNNNQVWQGKDCRGNFGAYTNNEDRLVDIHRYKNGICIYRDGLMPALWNEEDQRYEIYNAGQLYWFAALVNGNTGDIAIELDVVPNTVANAIVMKDIVVNDDVLTENGALNGDGSNFLVWTPIGTIDSPYTGIFDGNNMTISGLYCSEERKTEIGLFGSINSAVVANVNVADSYFFGNDYVGGIVGMNDNGTVFNCTNSATVSGAERIGGIVGLNSGLVDMCNNTGNIIGHSSDMDSAIGGIVGRNYDGTVSNCANTGSVSGKGGPIGGVVGHNYGTVDADAGVVTKCFNTGFVSSTGDYVGGVVGWNGSMNVEEETDSTVTNCYNWGTIRGNQYIAGVAAYNDGIVSQCYNVGLIEGESRGAVVAVNKGDAYNGYYLENDIDDNQELSVHEGTEEKFNSGYVTYYLNSTQDAIVFGQFLNEDGTGEADPYPVFLTENNRIYTGRRCDGSTWYTNKAELANTRLGHVFDNGFCTVCDAYEEPEQVDGVYQIANAGQLYWFAALVNGDTYAVPNIVQNTSADAVLTANITVNEKVLDEEGYQLGYEECRIWHSIGYYDWPDPVSTYTGHFDGQGFTISGLSMFDGLFGVIGADATVRNVGIVNSASCGGGIVHYNEGTVTNCYFSGKISWSGGIAVYNHGEVTNCYSVGNFEYSGGIAAYNYGEVTNCYSVGNFEYSSGIVDYNEGTVTNCYSVGNFEYGSGVIGYNAGEVTNCYYLEGTADWGIEYDEGAVAGEAEAKTAEQFAFGEVAYLLNGDQTTIVFGQTVGTDPYPVFYNGNNLVSRGVYCPGNIEGYSSHPVPVDPTKHTFKNVTCIYCGLNVYDFAVEKLAELQAAMENKDSELAAKIAELEAALAALEEAYKDADAALEEKLTALINEAKAELAAAIKELADRVTANEDAIAKLEEAIEDLKKAMEDKDSELAAKIEALEKALAAVEEAYKAADAALEEKLTALINEAKAELEAAIEELAARVTANEADIKDLKDALVLLKDELRAEFVAKLEEQIAALEAIYATKEELATAVEELWTAINSGNTDLVQKIEKLRTTLNAAIAANNATAIELTEQINKAKSALQSAINKLEVDLTAAMLAGDSALDEKITALQAALDAAIAACDADDEALKQELKNAVATLNAAIAANAEAIADARAEFNAQVEQLTTENKQLNTLVIVAIVIASVAMAGCAGLVTYIIIEKRKLIK